MRFTITRAVSGFSGLAIQFASDSRRPEGSLPMNVVVRTSDGAVSLLVDEIGDVVNVASRLSSAPSP